jgi:putative membrane protein
MEIQRFLQQFNWRFLLVRIVVNALALAGTAAFLPKIYFVDKTLSNWLLMALLLGVLNALLKPVLQFLTLPFIFITYGLVVVLVNALLLWLLSFIFPNLFAVDNLLWLLIGGLVLGLLSSYLESLLGLTLPILPDEQSELRREIEQQARQVRWLTAGSHGAVPVQQIPETEPPAPEANLAELSTPEPDEGTSPSTEVQEEPSDSMASADKDSPHEPQSEQEEDPS